MEMKWEDPGLGKGNKRDWKGIAVSLRANPGEWAVIAEDINNSVGTTLRTGKYKNFRPVGDWEFVTRGTNANGRTEKLFGRYVGDAE
jgi:hypothetical protein